ncbi:cupredoxin domain-containing protein [Cupriavidus sp. CV2]|uniref:cupredoxin domain-containing protein n=1 Tax=Cupriavidus ulmosensis TaxID=3065913 RepID=UPI00296AEEEB|nr:cupredoxin domain-containing protein [Cupriavidus sp. CV2]MDW3685404.1 cupredoxin domain-containing protein [Cupriavidus sp. CV2]
MLVTGREGISRRRALCCLLALAGGTPLLHSAAAAPRVIKVHARKFVFTPNRIALRVGEPVVFELTAQDVIMGFSVPDLGIRADLPPGKVVRVSALPKVAGSFGFLCDIFCGSGHETMNGVIEVS